MDSFENLCSRCLFMEYHDGVMSCTITGLRYGEEFRTDCDLFFENDYNIDEEKKGMRCKCCIGCRDCAFGECAGLSEYKESCKRCEDYPLKTVKSLEKSGETDKNKRGRE